MVITQHRAKRKATGGRYIASRGKRKFEMGRKPVLTKIDKRKAKLIKTKSRTKKTKLLTADTANLFDPKTKTYSQVKIKEVLENPADRHFVRRNIVTKGAVIETEKGKAKVTSRPGQEGTVNAVLI
jgi:small subunit ribosomal protein S8e